MVVLTNVMLQHGCTHSFSCFFVNSFRKETLHSMWGPVETILWPKYWSRTVPISTFATRYLLLSNLWLDGPYFFLRMSLFLIPLAMFFVGGMCRLEKLH